MTNEQPGSSDAPFQFILIGIKLVTSYYEAVLLIIIIEILNSYTLLIQNTEHPNQILYCYFFTVSLVT